MRRIEYSPTDIDIDPTLEIPTLDIEEFTKAYETDIELRNERLDAAEENLLSLGKIQDELSGIEVHTPEQFDAIQQLRKSSGLSDDVLSISPEQMQNSMIFQDLESRFDVFSNNKVLEGIIEDVAAVDDFEASIATIKHPELRKMAYSRVESYKKGSLDVDGNKIELFDLTLEDFPNINVEEELRVLIKDVEKSTTTRPRYGKDGSVYLETKTQRDPETVDALFKQYAQRPGVMMNMVAQGFIDPVTNTLTPEGTTFMNSFILDLKRENTKGSSLKQAKTSKTEYSEDQVGFMNRSKIAMAGLLATVPAVREFTDAEHLAIGTNIPEYTDIAFNKNKNTLYYIRDSEFDDGAATINVVHDFNNKKATSKSSSQGREFRTVDRIRRQESGADPNVALGKTVLDVNGKVSGGFTHLNGGKLNDFLRSLDTNYNLDATDKNSLEALKVYIPELADTRGVGVFKNAEYDFYYNKVITPEINKFRKQTGYDGELLEGVEHYLGSIGGNNAQFDEDGRYKKVFKYAGNIALNTNNGQIKLLKALHYFRVKYVTDLATNGSKLKPHLSGLIRRYTDEYLEDLKLLEVKPSKEVESPEVGSLFQENKED